MKKHIVHNALSTVRLIIEASKNHACPFASGIMLINKFATAVFGTQHAKMPKGWRITFR